ncbi:MAG: hypothetical protein HFJ37_05465 [Clostridia bacterium]|nr:hypothetical protein [Clostridia bacterium]
MEKIDRDDILLKIYEGQKKMQNQIEEIQEKISVIPEIQEKISVIPEMQKEIRKISKTVAKIEVEHGEKLQALFDAFTMHSEKLKTHEKRMNIFDRKLEKHNDEIYYLKSKVRGL